MKAVLFIFSLLLMFYSYGQTDIERSNSTPPPLTYDFKKLYLIKKKADSLLIENYGKTFLENNIVWRASKSICMDESGEENDFLTLLSSDKTIDFQPIQFLLEYDMRHGNEWCHFPIRIILDSKGQMKHQYKRSKYSIHNYRGLQATPNDADKNTLMTLSEAVLAAQSHGYEYNTFVEVEAVLFWKYNKDYRFKAHNGDWRIHVIEYIKDIGYKKEPNEAYRLCDVYVFNPWTKEFIEKKRMKFYDDHELIPIVFDRSSNVFPIFGEKSYLPPVSYDSLTFFNLKNRIEKRLKGKWVSKEALPPIKGDSLFLHLFFDNHKSMSIGYSKNKLDLDDETVSNRLWHANRNTMGYFSLINGRFESERDLIFHYRKRRKKLTFYFHESEKIVFERVRS